jgi:Ran GTPase-activating protein (RanGAP) involved in mRNA processing and transport
MSRTKDQHMKISEMENLLPEADNEVYNRLLSAGQSSPTFSVVMDKIIEIKSIFSLHRGFVNQPRLMELRLPGRNFNDQDMANLSLILTQAGVLPQLCLLDVSTNCIQCEGITALCSALCDACPSTECELTSLWLQHNRIGPDGCLAIARLLSSGYMLHTLDVEDNCMGDVGIGTITLSLIVPEKDLFEDDEGEPDISHLPQDVQDNIRKQQQKQAEEDARYVGNQTITSLNISNNNFGRETMDNISQILKTNKVLKKLNMDCVLTVKPKDIANFINCCKVYNKTLTELTMTDTAMPASVVGMLFKVLNSKSPLSRLGLARCGLTDLHLLRNVKMLGSAKYLTHLNLSGNPLSDGLVPALCVGIEGQIDRDSGKHIPPLENLDMSDCGLTFKGALQIVRTIAGRSCVKHLDLSSNALAGSDEDGKKAFAEALQMTALHTINLNRCQLGTKQCEYILLALKSIDDRLCGFHLRRLLLSENNIHDSVDNCLFQFLSENTQIQLLDIGFNKLTSKGLETSQQAVKVYSDSNNALKLHDLHINLLGNPCEKEYLLDYPGMARSKVTLRFGHERSHDAMEHIQTELRDHYMDRQKVNGDLQVRHPTSRLVKFNDCT